MERTMDANHTSLIQQVEATNELEQRYKDLKCVNVNPSRRRGVNSIVFQGLDILENKYVAVKFMDPNRISDQYKVASFEREAELIEKLRRQKRVINIVSNIKTFNWKLIIPNDPTKTVAKIPIKYFVTEWIEEDIDDYFLLQHQVEAIIKLKIFRLILLAIESIHSNNISHRDIKADNLRLRDNGVEQIIVVIDFGTSARIDSPNIAATYYLQVGAPAYSAPETFVGFAGERRIAHLTDIYALGCLLYELFNKEIFSQPRSRNPYFSTALTLMKIAVDKHSTLDDKLKEWRDKMRLIKYNVAPPPFVGPSCVAPTSVQTLLNSAYTKMVQFDFNARHQNLATVLRTIDSAIKVLRNDVKQKQILEKKRESRRKRLEKIQMRKEKLEQRLLSRKSLC